jgi:hypothetical protein
MSQALRDRAQQLINELAPTTRRDDWWASEGPYEIIMRALEPERFRRPVKPKVEAAARALAQARGFEPDMLMWPGYPLQDGTRNYVQVSDYNPALPAWRFFISEADAVLEALNVVR